MNSPEKDNVFTFSNCSIDELPYIPGEIPSNIEEMYEKGDLTVSHPRMIAFLHSKHDSWWGVSKKERDYMDSFRSMSCDGSHQKRIEEEYSLQFHDVSYTHGEIASDIEAQYEQGNFTFSHTSSESFQSRSCYECESELPYLNIKDGFKDEEDIPITPVNPHLYRLSNW